MVGDTIHIILRQDLKKVGLDIISLHESFDPAKEELWREADYYEKIGYVVDRDSNSPFFFVKAVDRPLWYYFISSRTIDK